MAPIDPAHLLKALDPLLFDEGGIKEISASQFASLMKKFSKKLVSRCVYINVLSVTKPDVLEKVLDQGGWCTINSWLTDAKESNHQSFLIKLLTLCKLLPMTIERLKENNTPKIVKSLSKFENEKIVALSNELVTKWMTTIKGENAAVDNMKKKKKIKLPKENNKEQKDPKKSPKKESSTKEKHEPSIKEKHEPSTKEKHEPSTKEKHEPSMKEKNEVKKEEKTVKESPKLAARIRGPKRTSSDKGIPPEELYEDVKIEIKPEPLPKKPKLDRPKTVKSFKGKFRATGLEEAAPLPKKIPKKTPTIDKNAAAVVAKNAVVKRLNTTLPERIIEKKIKPENLLNINETTPPSGGIKLIPAKPRPAHILHESASFMDALVAQPAPPIKRKKKSVAKPTTPTTPPTPTSPPIKPPKLQFYKDTLEMNNEEPTKEDETKSKEEEASKNDETKTPESPPREESKAEETPENVAGESPSTPVNETELAENCITKEMEKEDEDSKEKDADESSRDVEESEVTTPGQLRSILSHGRRKRKKSVKWVEDENLKQMFYFELDETERVNVLRNRPFGDLKSLEAKREREAFEAAKRHAGDKMEEMIPWWIVPILIDIPPPLAEPGYLSEEKELQRIRQQSVLQAIYFTRDSIPDTPQEPESEMVAPQEPKIIPLDEENIVGSMVDYSTQKMPVPKTSLPEVLSSLMNIPPLTRSLPSQPTLVDQVPSTTSVMMSQPTPASPTSPYDPGEPVTVQMASNPNVLPQQPLQPQPPPLMAQPPPSLFNAPTLRPLMETEVPMPITTNWSGIDPNLMPMNPPEAFFPGVFPNPMAPYSMMDPNMHPGMNPSGMRPIRNRMMGPVNKPGPYPRPGGPRRGVPRVPCRHFIAGGCRFGATCSFLHPGINGPPL